jgi:hypothetical protein
MFNRISLVVIAALIGSSVSSGCCRSTYSNPCCAPAPAAQCCPPGGGYSSAAPYYGSSVSGAPVPIAANGSTSAARPIAQRNTPIERN